MLRLRRALQFVLFGALASSACGPATPRDAAECRAFGLRDFGRPLELRLDSLEAWSSCESPVAGRCATAHLPKSLVSSWPENCDEAVRQQVAALQKLVLRPDETNEALEMIEDAANRQPPDAIRWNDLAVAYALRAERDGRPADWVFAHAAVTKAVALDGNSSAARFNQALIEEAMLPPSLSLGAWEAVAATEAAPAWAEEARARQAKLAARRDLIAAHSWTQTKDALLAAAEGDDRQSLGELIRRYPSRASNLVQTEWLHEWAIARTAGDAPAAAAYLERARRLAEGILAITGDRLGFDAVAEIDRAAAARDLGRLKDLTTGHRLPWTRDPGARGIAQKAFDRAASPLAAWIELQGLGQAIESSLECSDSDLTRLKSLAAHSRAAGHSQMAALALSHRGYCLQPEVASLAAYEAALEALGTDQDTENIARIETRRSEILFVLGDAVAGWEKLSASILRLDAQGEADERMTLLITAAKLATALDSPELAIRLLSAAIDEEELSHSAFSDRGRPHLAVAHRERGLARTYLGRLAEAAEDLEKAKGFTQGDDHESALRPLLLVAQAELLANSDPEAALAQWSSALDQLGTGSPAFLRARLYFRRAKLYRQRGETLRFEGDLDTGLRLIEAEERRNLTSAGAALGDPYFGRFSEVVEQLVMLLLDSGRAPETFLRLERARAYEPLNRLRDLPLAPLAFQALTRGDAPLDVAAVRDQLPVGTALLSYSVLPDRLLIWVLTRASAHSVVVPIDRATVRDWVRNVRYGLRSNQGLRAALEAPYAPLVAEPLAALADEPVERLVLVLDEELHQLPFAALRNSHKGTYLVEEKILSVAPSAALYLYSQMRDADLPRDPNAHALLVGDPAFDPHSPFARGLDRLAEARDEVEAIQPLYPSSTLLVEEEATPSRWLEELPRAAVVHYGGHAVANERVADRSFLHLAPDASTPGELFARDLVGSDSLPRTRLVVLAACSTVGGLPIGPLGLAPLVRPFLGAGVPAVVGTLWDVDSYAAREFSEEFHSGYRQGGDAAVALREAQLAMLRSSNAAQRHEGAWAAYQLVGFASSPFPPRGGAF